MTKTRHGGARAAFTLLPIMPLAVLLLAACSGRSSPGEPPEPASPEFADVPVEEEVARAHEDFQGGDDLFQAACTECHTVSGSTGSAPPADVIVRHYRQRFQTNQGVRDAIVLWIEEPDPARSAMPPEILELYGLMPAMPLPEHLARQVARYLLSVGREGPDPGG